MRDSKTLRIIGKTVLANAETIVNSDGTESFIPNAGIFMAALIVAVLLIAVLVPVWRQRRGGAGDEA